MHPKLPEEHKLCCHVLYNLKKEDYIGIKENLINNLQIKNIIFDIGNVLLKFDPDASPDNSVSPVSENIKLLEALSKYYKIYAITDASLEQIKFEREMEEWTAENEEKVKQLEEKHGILSSRISVPAMKGIE